MRRVGPWVLGAGMALMVAGIGSSALDLWAPVQQLEQEAGFTLREGGAVDIRGTRVDSITLDAGSEAVLRYTLLRPDAAAGGTPSASWRQEDGAWTLEADLGYGEARGVELELPAHASRLAGQGLDVKARTRVQALHVEGTYVRWAGDAGTLLLQAVPLGTSRCGEATRVSSVGFDEGEVDALRIISAQGEVRLGDLSRVGDVELRLAPDVRLQVARAADLERIRILPYEDEALAVLADDSGALAASMACSALRGH